MTLPGEGAFYGPKIEFHIRMPSVALAMRNDAGRFLDAANASAPSTSPSTTTRRHIRSCCTGRFRSLERFIGILIENWSGGTCRLAIAGSGGGTWNISDAQADYAQMRRENLRKAGFRVEADLRNEKITYKIREHSLNRLPYQIVDRR